MAQKSYEILLAIGGKLESSLTKSASAASKALQGIQKSGEKVSKGVSGGFGVVKGAALGLASTLAGGAGLFEVVNKAVEAGDATYELSKKMGITNQEALGLSRVLKVTDTSADAVTGTMMRLDKGVESAGTKGNATSKALAEFGVKLTDTHGKLLPMTDQLQALADGYQRAATNGNEEAYAAQVLGNRGKDLIPMLANYKDAAEAASKVKGIVPIDPVAAHKMKEDLTALKMQVSMFGMAIASALLPVAQAILPTLMTLFQQLAAVIAAHRAQITGAINGIVSVIKGIAGAVASVASFVMPIISGFLDKIFGPQAQGPIKKFVGSLSFVKDAIVGIFSGNKGKTKSALTALGFSPAEVQKIQAIITGLKQFLQQALPQYAQLVMQNFGIIAQTVKTVWPTVRQVIVTVVQAVLTMMRAAWPAIVAYVQTAQVVIKQVIQTAWPIIKAIIQTVLTYIVPFVVDMFTKIAAFIKSVMPAIQTIITVVLTTIRAVWTVIWPVLKAVVIPIFLAISTGIKVAMDIIMGVISVALNLITGRGGVSIVIPASNITIVSKAKSGFEAIKKSVYFTSP